MSFVVIAPLEQKEAVMATPLNGGWGEPAADANGLCAWGVADILVLPDTVTSLAAIDGVQIVSPDGQTVARDVFAVVQKGVVTDVVRQRTTAPLAETIDDWRAAVGWTDVVDLGGSP